MMKNRIYLLLTTLLLSLSVLGASKDVEAMQALVKRLIPEYAKQFEFKNIKTPNGKDQYCIESMASGKILITGNNANSMAMGLNHYLKYNCLTTVSWYSDVPVEMPETLPVLDKPFCAEAQVDRRFFLNYCTYGYTMPFWDWDEWERLIDWMALNGINMPLAITGQEAVWYNVWKKLGLTDEEIRSYFTGPTYLPWHRMANIDGWNGPLPMEWLEHQPELQKKILTRERELNMKPVLPAFAGHVPGALKRIYPDTNIQHLSKWAGFTEEYRCNFLNPEEPLFAIIQKHFLDEQTQLFGTDHIYGVDPFNEVDPPSWEPEYLAQVSSDMYQTLTAADPKAEWMQMTWMFYFDRKDWTDARVEALLKGVPQGKMVLLDYHCENVELWKNTNHFHGQPYIWCYLGNFGGNTTLTGNVKESGARLENALINGGDNLCGVGSTLEGLDVQQFPYEYIFEKAWTPHLKDDDWVNALADRHVGKPSHKVREAWNILFNDIHIQVPKTLAVLPNLRPEMNKPNKRTVIDYTNESLYQAFNQLLQTSDASRDALQLDIITVGRQLLGNHFLTVKDEFDKSYQAKDLEALETYGTKMIEILNDMDQLNAYHPRCTVTKWLADARALGNTPQLQNYYEKNARNLITTWGGRLNDYASRTWAGLINDYYANRWAMYIDAVKDAVIANQSFDQDALDEQMSQYEEQWVNSVNPVVVKPGNDLLTFARYLNDKYRNKISN